MIHAVSYEDEIQTCGFILFAALAIIIIIIYKLAIHIENVSTSI